MQVCVRWQLPRFIHDSCCFLVQTCVLGFLIYNYFRVVFYCFLCSCAGLILIYVIQHFQECTVGHLQELHPSVIGFQICRFGKNSLELIYMLSYKCYKYYTLVTWNLLFSPLSGNSQVQVSVTLTCGVTNYISLFHLLK